ncbi:MAG: DNA-directed RNA polymerase subunit omega [Nitrospirae bacterium]|nr:DNA-directed RNA polymerase subunit omega [Nitrospirota bacterium]
MDIISLPIEFDKEKIDGRYRFVTAAAARARQLAQGAQLKVTTKSKKTTTISMEEIVSGALNVLTGEKAVIAKEKAKGLTYEQMMDEAKQKEALPEDLTELEKDLKAYLHEKGERDSSGKSIEDIFGKEG